MNRTITNTILLVLLLPVGSIVSGVGCDKDAPGPGVDAAQQDGQVQTDGQTQQDGQAQTDGQVSDGQVQQDGQVQTDGQVSDGQVQTDGGQPGDGGPGPDGLVVDGGGGVFDITCSNVVMWANCQPIVPADPWHLTFDLTYDNSQGGSPVTATITDAEIHFQSSGNPTLDINVTPSTVGPIAAGATQIVTHTKVSSNNDIPNDCNLCGDMSTVVVTVDIGTTSPIVVTCPAQQAMCAS